MPCVTHYPMCTADYPEKQPGEPAQKIEPMDIGDGETVHTCVDCGAFTITRTTLSSLPRER